MWVVYTVCRKSSKEGTTHAPGCVGPQNDRNSWTVNSCTEMCWGSVFTEAKCLVIPLTVKRLGLLEIGVTLQKLSACPQATTSQMKVQLKFFYAYGFGREL